MNNSSQLFQFYYQNYVRPTPNLGPEDIPTQSNFLKNTKYQDQSEFAGNLETENVEPNLGHSTYGYPVNCQKFSPESTDNGYYQSNQQQTYSVNPQQHQLIDQQQQHLLNNINTFTPYKNSPGQNGNIIKKSTYLTKRSPFANMPSHMLYDTQTVYELMRKSEKNPIALLHEYCSKIKKNVTYQFDVRNENSRPKREHYVCSIYIDGIGVISRGDGTSKKEAKNNAGEKALSLLINSDNKARGILGELLERQSSSCKKPVMNMVAQNHQQIPHVHQQTPQMVQPQMGSAQTLLSAQKKPVFEANPQKLDFPPPSVDKTSLQDLLRNDSNFLARLSTFANSLSLNLKWKIRQDKTLSIAECMIGEMKACAVYRKKRTAKLLAAKNMLRVIDSDPNMKQKFLHHIYGNNISEPLSESSTNLSFVREMKSSLKAAVDSVNGQQKLATTKKFDEPQEILKWFQSQDNCISVNNHDLKGLKDTFEDVSSQLKYTLENDNLQLIPVGSFVIGCTRKNNFTMDSYLHQDKRAGALTCSEIVRLYEEKKFSGEYQAETNSDQIFKFSLLIEKDQLNMEEYILFKHQNNVNKIRVFVMSLCNNEGTRIMNHYTAGIYHSNWLVQNLSQGQNNPSTIRLFRLVREWKNLKGFTFLPSEILDLTLSYATFSFKETGVFKVLLKFFTLLTLMLCQHNQSFYDQSDYHAFLVNQINYENKNKIIEAAQKTFANQSVNNTSDFTSTSNTTSFN